MSFFANKKLIFRYGISGITGAVLQTLILYIWVSILGLQAHYLWGVVVGFCIAVTVTFILQKYWTFADREHHHQSHRQFMIYSFTALGSLGLNAMLLQLSKMLFESMGIDFFHVWYLVAQIIIIFIAAVFSFLINYSFTFKTRAN
ncbi:MAG TPA: GtrA family protein [Candidatus Paceibacterota bacterium]